MNLDLRDHISKQIISFGNAKEMGDILEFLVSMNFKVYNESGVRECARSNDTKGYNAFRTKCGVSNTKDFVRTSTKYPTMSYGDVMGIIKNKKYSKIENPDFDPYGEEDWGWKIEESFDGGVNLDLRDYISTQSISYSNWKEMRDIFNVLLDLKFTIYNVMGIRKEIECGCMTQSYNSFTNDVRHYDFCRSSLKDGTLTYDEFMKIIGSKKIKKIENPVEDPYGEEDWGWKIEESFGDDAKEKFIVRILSPADLDIIMMFLQDRGYTWADGDSLTSSLYASGIFRIKVGECLRVGAMYCENNKKPKIVKKGQFDFYTEHKDDYLGFHFTDSQDFIKMFVDKKYKRIEQPDIDPFGEEDWGWKIEENVEYEETIMFKDLYNIFDDYDAMIRYLNEFENNKRVYFIGEDGIYYKDDIKGSSWRVVEYISTSDIKRVLVKMSNGQTGNAIGLTYLDPTTLYRKYKKIEKPEIDPYGEENWGFVEIKESFEDNPEEFEVGDEVVLNGDVRIGASFTRRFKGEIGTITKTNDMGSVARTDMYNDKFGAGSDCRYYHGKIYRVKYLTQDNIGDNYWALYWVSPWNMTKVEDKIKPQIKWYNKGRFENFKYKL